MRVSIRKTAVAAIFVFAIAFILKAEQFNDRFLQTQWTTESGLPQNSVTAITQTPDGYLWLGTFGGLARFDGVRFKIFTTSNYPQIKSNRITALTTDIYGTLWIGTQFGEIIIYKESKFTLIDDGKNVNNAAIIDLYSDKEGIVWAGNIWGLKKCTAEGCQKQNFSKTVNRIKKDSQGNFWIVSEKKLHKFQEGEFAEESAVTGNVIEIIPNPAGGIWIVKNDEFGIYRNGIYKTIKKLKEGKSFAGTNLTKDGNLMLNVGEILYFVSEETVKEYKIENLVDPISRQVFIDYEGNVWLGFIGDGLIRLLPSRVENVETKNGFPKDAANSIAEDRSGNIWISTNKGLYQRKNGIGSLAIIDKSDKDNLARGTLLFDSEGTLWNVTSEGLQSYRNGKFQLHKEISWDKAPTGNCLFEDSRKNLWVCGEEKGVIVTDRKRIIAHYSTENGLIGNTIYNVFEARDGAVWLAARNGISRLKDGEITNYTSQDGLSNNYVRDIYEDADGTFWFGTYGGGLNRFRNGKFTAITAKDGLFEDIVSRLLVDDEDNFWMLGNRGVFSVSRKILNDFAEGRIKRIYCMSFTASDGMASSEGNGGYQNGGIRAGDGRFWFPMIKSVVVIDPKTEKLPIPTPLLEEVFLDGKEIDISQMIEINPENKNLEISYTGLSFRKPEQIRFRYRLDGLDEDWTEAGTRRTVSYSYLPPGNYRFQLQTANADGVWSEQIASFEVKVQPPFYRTWWFFLLAVLMVLIISVTVIRYRNRNFAQAKSIQEEFTRKLLNAQENERRKIAADIHDNFGQQFLVIKNWTAFCLNKLPKQSNIREQLLQIDETATQALNEIRQMAKSLSPYHLDKAGLTNTLRFMVKQIAESGEIEFHTEIENIDGILSKEEELNLYRIVQESLNNIVRHSGATQASIVLKKIKNNLRLLIQDNGIGFRQEENDIHKSGLGLNGIQKRTQMINGEVSIQSAPGKGTKILVEIKRKKEWENEKGNKGFYSR